ncbi:MAG: DEAD/DEAH box helicase family protein [Massilia sp.]|nr:DEAD/DEAH box helicase family protein [Massilia sp.]
MRKHVITAEADLVVPSDSAVGESHPADANAKPESKFCRTFDLDNARRNQSKKFPAAHQQQALGKLRAWFQSAARAPAAGAIVALPTGGGKTFTAVRFLCHGPLSQGYKVVWLAHTHHLLEQAYESFAPTDLNKASEIGVEVGLIAEPKSALTMRVVSGTLGHFQPHMIQGSDDVIIVTLQTLTRAWENRKLLRGLRDFFTAAGEKLFVVFDEAHHAPAAGYRALSPTCESIIPRCSCSV